MSAAGGGEWTCDIFNAMLSPGLPIAAATITQGTIAIKRVTPLRIHGRMVQLINPSQIICPTIVAMIDELCPEKSKPSAKRVPATGARFCDNNA